MRNTRNSTELRMAAARAAAPYVHARVPPAVVVCPEAKIEGVRVEIVGAPQYIQVPPGHALAD